MPDALREVSPTLHQLRSWHRSQDLPQEAAAQTPDDTDPLWLSDVALACLLAGQTNKSRTLLETALACPRDAG